jgi:hypothetical protein
MTRIEVRGTRRERFISEALICMGNDPGIASADLGVSGAMTAVAYPECLAACFQRAVSTSVPSGVAGCHVGRLAPAVQDM